MSTTTEPPKDPAEENEVFADLNTILLATCLLVILAIGYKINTGRIKNIPESGMAMILGFVLSLTVRVLDIMKEEEVMTFKGNFFFYVLLPPIIFEAGFALDTQMFMDNFGAILAFAIVGTLASTWITSTSLYWMAGQGDIIGLDINSPRLKIHCHMFGALISATDPVATIALFCSPRFKADPLLHSLINGESILNDAVAIALFSTLNMHVNDPDPQLLSTSVLGHFLFISVFSLILGLVAGAFTSWSYAHAKFLNRFPETEISGMCLSGYITFALAQALGLSGIVAIFFFGAVLSQYNNYNLSESSKVASHITFTVLAKLAESMVFLYLGVATAFSIGKYHWNFNLVGFTVLIICIARALHIFPLSRLLNMSRREDDKISKNLQTVLWISGLRGAIAFALSLQLPCENRDNDDGTGSECKNTDLLLTTTIAIVIMTTLVIGTAMEKIMMAFGVLELADMNAPPAAHGHGGGHGAASASDGVELQPPVQVSDSW